MSAKVEEFHERRARIETEMGGAKRVAAVHDAGRLTVRERIDRLLDPGSFVELGTFSRSNRVADRGETPGDGKIGGHGMLRGRKITVAGDDVTVKRASSALIGSRKLKRLYEQASEAGNPFVYLGETGGARIPDTMGAEGFTSLPPYPELGQRRRRIPMATAILGDSFGGSSFHAALSDFVVQLDGSCMSVTSPRVIEVATGEVITNDELGGAAVHSRVTGMIDRVAATEQEALDAIADFLSYLPSNSWTRPERAPVDREPEADEDLAALVPENRRRAYDMRKVIERLVDGGEMLELKPEFARSVVTSLARIDGHAVGVVASQPLFWAGVLDPDACDKIASLIALCDSFDLPLVFLQDTPGFLVGRQVEHDRMLHKAILLHQATMLASVPRITVVLRKAFGLAHQVLSGCGMGADLVLAWPGAEIGFMDPAVGTNVVYKTQLDLLSGEEREEERARLEGGVADSTDPYEAAGVLTLDEIIDPANTRTAIAVRLGQLEGRRFRQPAERLLSDWPTCW